MSTTAADDLKARRLGATLREHGLRAAPPERRSFAERFTASEAYRRRRGQAAVASARESVGELRLRAYSDLTPFSVDGLPKVGWLPLPALVPQLVETIESTEVSVYLTSETSEVPAAGGGRAGTPLPEGAVVFPAQATLTEIPRFGTAWPVTKGVLDNAGVVQSMLQRRLSNEFLFNVENLVLAGPAGDPNGTGILSTPAVPTVAKGGSDVYRLDTIARALAVVQSAGWYTSPPALAAHPTTLEAIRVEKAAAAGNLYAYRDEVVPDIDVWVPSTQIPPGTAIVGDWFNAVALFVYGDLTVEIATAHEDHFVRDMVEMKLENRTLIWVREPTALCLATGLA